MYTSQTYQTLPIIDASQMGKTRSILPKVEQSTINQRIKFLIDKLATSARAFSDAIDDSPTNTQNYIGPRQTAPKHEYLAKVVRHFSNVNAQWLLTGEGEPFIGEVPTAPVNINNRKNKGPVQNSTGSHATNITNNVSLEDCQRDLATAKSESDLLREQLASKDALLAAKDVVIAAKDETITLLRATYNRPN